MTFGEAVRPQCIAVLCVRYFCDCHKAASGAAVYVVISELSLKRSQFVSIGLKISKWSQNGQKWSQIVSNNTKWSATKSQYGLTFL